MASSHSREPAVPTEHRNLQLIEQRIVHCVEVAAQVAEELSNVGKVNKQKIAELCMDFLNNIKAAQEVISDAVKVPGVGVERHFEANVYQHMLRAYAENEKVQVVGLHLANIMSILQSAKTAAGAHTDALGTVSADDLRDQHVPQMLALEQQGSAADPMQAMDTS